MNALTTRPAVLADIPAITAIYAEQVLYGAATFELVPPDEAEMMRRMAALTEGAFPYVIAERDSRIVGYAYAGPYRPRPGYRHTVEDSIYIACDCRGQGIGGVLLRLLIEQSTALGFRQMIAVIGDSQNMASVRVHAAAGFVPAGTFRSVGYKHGRWLDSVHMQRPLGPGDGSDPSRP
jgi:L-amino acid N-acyltransferase YncA